MADDYIDEDAYWGARAAEERQALAEAYDYAVSIDFNLTSNSEEMGAAVDGLLADLRTTDAARGGHRRPKQAALRVVLANLCRNYADDPTLYTAYPRHHEGYPDRRYNPPNVKWRGMQRVVDGLAELGHTETVRGFYCREYGTGRNSRMRAAQYFIEFLEGHFGLTAVQIHRDRNEETIILRRDDKHPIPYEDSATTRGMRQQLAGYNDLLSRTDISVAFSDEEILEIAGRPIDFTAKQYRRIFKRGSFEKGGRFYGPWWVNAKQQIRDQILIDGQPTVECDYSGQHFHILYSLEGINYHQLDGDRDPYAIAGADGVNRDFLKTMSLVAINATSRPGTLTSLRNKLRQLADHQNINLSELLPSFEEKHEPIRSYFYSDAGVMLQYRDSLICEYVIERLIRLGIVGLAIHDSFIVKRCYEAILRRIMIKAYEAYGLCSIPRIRNNL